MLQILPGCIKVHILYIKNHVYMYPRNIYLINKGPCFLSGARYCCLVGCSFELSMSETLPRICIDIWCFSVASTRSSTGSCQETSVRVSRRLSRAGYQVPGDSQSWISVTQETLKGCITGMQETLKGWISGLQETLNVLLSDKQESL